MSRVGNKKPRRSDSTTTGISKRTGLSRDEIQRMRREALRDAREGPSVERRLGYTTRPPVAQPKKELDPFNLAKDPPRTSPSSPIVKKLPVSVEVDAGGIKGVGLSLGVGQVSAGREGIGASIGGVGFKIDESGGGEITTPGVRIVFKREGCFTVETRLILGSYAGSNIQKDPSCSSDDDDDDSDEPKPPHCLNSDGTGGSGEPKNLYPSCIDDGSIRNYWILINHEFKRVWEDWDWENGGKYNRENYALSKLGDFATNSNGSTYTQQYSIYSKVKGNFQQSWNAWTGEVVTGVATSPKYTYPAGSPFIVGTGEAVRAWLRDNNIPRTDEVVNYSANWQIPGQTFEDKTTNKYWAVVGTDDPNCKNPTGDEGCGNNNDSDSDPNKGKNNPPYWGKPPSKIDRDRDRDEEDEEMKCCEETKELLLLVLDHVGYNLSPIEVPSSLTDDENVTDVIIPNIPSFLIWWFGRWDEVTGQFPQTIKIEDANPLESGNQPETIILNNQAESFAELYAEVMTVLQQQQVLLEVCFKGLLTGGLNRESGIRSEKMLDAIIDYLGFGIKEKNLKVKQLFNAMEDSEDWAKVLEEKNSNVRVVEIDDKANLQLSLTELLQAASIIRARYFTRVNPDSVKSQLKSQMKGSIGLLNRLQGIGGDKEKTKEWEQFQKWVDSVMPDSEITPETDYWSR